MFAKDMVDLGYGSASDQHISKVFYQCEKNFFNVYLYLRETAHEQGRGRGEGGRGSQGAPY